MKALKIAENHFILGHRCIEAAKDDFILVGAKGAMWEYSSTKFFILQKRPDGDEVGKIVSKADAKKWVKRLEVSNNPDQQIEDYLNLNR
jgi:hypothetical protein